jgi:methylmalonyl-CoA mutase N-terminal domain/subunit
MSGKKKRPSGPRRSLESRIQGLYTEDDLRTFKPGEALGRPGEFPFTRGIYPTMYLGRLWTMRQYAGYGTAAESNKRYRYLLAQGQTGLSVAFDLPTQLGLDSDDPMAAGEVGRVGVVVDSLEDMAILFEGIPLDKVSISMTINATAAAILAMYLALAEKRRIPWTSLSGTVQNDILKEYIARGTYIFPLVPSLRLITDVVAFCSERVPRWNAMSISGYHIREAGATAVQELAFTFANAITYCRALIERGLAIDLFAPRLSFFLAVHNDFFEEIAKFRAARRIWAHLMRDRFGAKNPNSWRFRFHTQTSGSTLVAQQPENNVARVTLQALASVLGGTQSLHTNARDEALALPSEESARIALRTQQIIAHESRVAETIDPLGGSYFLETLTNRMEEGVRAYLEKIERAGGMLRAIESGYVQGEIQDSAFTYQKLIEEKKRIIVGLNEYAVEGERLNLRIDRPPKALERAQAAKLARLKKTRSAARIEAKLSELEDAVRGGRNLMEPLVETAKAMGTLGEITAVFKKIFGEYRENLIL